MLSIDEVLARVEKAIARETRRLFDDPGYWVEYGAIPETMPTDFDPEELAQTVRELVLIHLTTCKMTDAQKGEITVLLRTRSIVEAVEMASL